MKTETVLKTVVGTQQYFKSELDMLDHYNRNRKLYTVLSVGDGTKKLIHKGHNMLIGFVETITNRDDEVAV